jgi:beta-1,4-mannosyl-glycoprotein beta-1,4-N-acetylglucosaminyltransferase
MTVYNCCTFFNENDIFEIRLNQHWDFVDKFIVIEAGETHTGVKKPFNFDHERFKPYASKIEYRSFDSFEEEIKNNPQLIDSNTLSDRGGNKNAMDWGRDNFQYNYAHKVLQELGAKDDDIVIQTCCDEMVSKKAFDDCVQRINSNPTKDWNFMFQFTLYAFKFNVVHKSWNRTDTTGNLMPYRVYKQKLIGTRREHRMCTDVIGDAGWHFCTMDKNNDGSMIQEKYKAWGHSRDIEPGRKPKYELTKEEALERFFEDMAIEKVVDVNYDNHPAYIVDNKDKFADYIVPIDAFD